MATPTYELIEATTLSSAVTSVEFTSLPQGFRDLVIVFNPIVSGGDGSARYRLNDDSGSNYNYVNMRGRLTAPASSDNANQSIMPITANALLNNTTGNRFTIEIMDYSATDKHKSTLEIHSYATGSTTEITGQAGRYASNSAITSIQFELFQGGGARNYDTNSTFAIYGIAS